MQQFTKVEVKVLECLAAGLQSKEIAHVVGRRKPTIEGYIRVLYLKLGAKSRAHLVALAYQVGVLAAGDHALTA